MSTLEAVRILMRVNYVVVLRTPPYSGTTLASDLQSPVLSYETAIGSRNNRLLFRMVQHKRSR